MMVRPGCALWQMLQFRLKTASPDAASCACAGDIVQTVTRAIKARGAITSLSFRLERRDAELPKPIPVSPSRYPGMMTLRRASKHAVRFSHGGRPHVRHRLLARPAEGVGQSPADICPDEPDIV